MPLQLLEDYCAYLLVKKGRARTRGHINEVRRRVARMLRGVERLEELTPEGIEARLLELLQEEVRIGRELRQRSRKTVDAHRRDFGTFLKWVVVKRRLLDRNPVDPVEAFEPDDARDLSRPFSPDEADRFFASIPAWRFGIYVFWATTGLRPAETKRLVASQLVLDPADGSPPYVQVLRAGSKNHKAVRQPLHPLVVEHLRGLELIGSEPVFQRVPTSQTFREDLRHAGLNEGRTAEGKLTRISLRKLFATGLGRLGFAEGLVQKLMRHSRAELTRNVYTGFELAEKAQAVAQLPFVPTRSPAA